MLQLVLLLGLPLVLPLLLPLLLVSPLVSVLELESAQPMRNRRRADHGLRCATR